MDGQLGPGAVIGGRFRLVDGGLAGGMATVHRGVDVAAADAPVAVKIVRVASPAERERFLREAAILARLSHPGIVRYIAHGGGDDLHYLVTEWVDGDTLAHRLATVGLTARESVALARHIAGALAAAHALGVVHRDLKPHNLIFPTAGDGAAKLIDFGVARPATDDARVTATGVAVGTPGYMSPEQARGAREVDARTDLFALGCVLYECLTGRPAFRGDGSAATLAKVLFAEPAPLVPRCPECPPALCAIVTRLLCKDPAARFQHATAVVAALAELGELPASVRRPALDFEVPITTQVTPGAVDDRLVLVVMVAPTASAVVSTAGLSPLVSAHGGRLEALADGSLAITIAGDGSPTVQAARAARAALALRAQLPDRAMVVACGATATGGLDDILDRAASMLTMQALFGGVVGVDGPAIYLDEVVAALIGRDFVLGDDAAGPVLVGERPAPPA